MKNIIFFLFLYLLTFSINAQTNTSLSEDFVTRPCQITWQQPGPVQGVAGDDFISGAFNIQETTLELTSIVSPNSTPYYYALTNNVVINCLNEMGKGSVDISSAYQKFSIRAKASANTTVQLYFQEGNSPSLNLSKCSSTILKINLTTTYQTFEISNISTTSFVSNQPNIDLTNIGMLVFEAKDGNNNVDFSGKIIIDYLCFSENCQWEIYGGTNELSQNSFSIFPSPAEDEINVNFQTIENGTISITDISGRTIKTEIISGGIKNKSFDVSELESGIYFMNISYGDGKAVSKFIVK